MHDPWWLQRSRLPTWPPGPASPAGPSRLPPLGPSSSPLLCVCSWLGQRAEPPRAAESESAQQCWRLTTSASPPAVCRFKIFHANSHQRWYTQRVIILDHYDAYFSTAFRFTLTLTPTPNNGQDSCLRTLLGDLFSSRSTIYISV